MWGGEKLKTILHKNYSAENIGESWELSDVERYESKVAAGFHSGKTIKELVSIYKDELVGKSVYEKFGNEFPLLIKFIDAKTPLSIQVHPGDEMAKHRHNSFGKNEKFSCTLKISVIFYYYRYRLHSAENIGESWELHFHNNDSLRM